MSLFYMEPSFKVSARNHLELTSSYFAKPFDYLVQLFNRRAKQWGLDPIFAFN